MLDLVVLLGIALLLGLAYAGIQSFGRFATAAEEHAEHTTRNLAEIRERLGMEEYQP